MELIEIKDLKEKVEREIGNIIRDFMDTTGTMVYDIDYYKEFVTRFSDGYKTDVVFKIELDVRV